MIKVIEQEFLSYGMGKVAGIILQKNDTFYFSRSIPSDLQRRFKKRKIEVSLRTKSESKAAKSAAALSNRRERYWDSLRMETKPICNSEYLEFCIKGTWN